MSVFLHDKNLNDDLVWSEIVKDWIETHSLNGRPMTSNDEMSLARLLRDIRYKTLAEAKEQP